MVMDEHGGIHFQIGRWYPYTRDRDEAFLKLLRELKGQVDPKGICESPARWGCRLSKPIVVMVGAGIGGLRRS